MSGRPGASERGAATVWAAFASAALCALVASVLAVGAAMVTRHRAAAAADLAALAAAGNAPAGRERACSGARWVATKMRVTLVSCRLDGLDALVRVAAKPAGPLGEFQAARAHARAGPDRKHRGVAPHTRNGRSAATNGSATRNVHVAGRKFQPPAVQPRV